MVEFIIATSLIMAIYVFLFLTVLSTIVIIRYNGMHKYSIPLTMVIYFNLEFSRIENQGQSRYEGNVRSEGQFSEVLVLLYFSGYYLFNIIKIPSISWIQILRHIPFFMLTSEYLEYIL
jgi:hypothetical protein